MNVYPFLYKHVFSKFDPETMHHLIMVLLRITSRPVISRTLLSRIFFINDQRLAVSALGLRFPNPIGIASGFDKNAEAVLALSSLGFGFIEVGTVTPLPQKGNPKPRLFRLLEDRAIINRLGFPNAGCAVVCGNLERVRQSSDVIVAASLGKNRETVLEESVQDYVNCMRALYWYSDLLVINVSSPNMPGLRMLQRRSFLESIATETLAYGRRAAKELGCKEKPILVKISPDLGEAELDDLLEVVVTSGIAGIIATNTTIRRKSLITEHREEMGGLSGRPLRAISTELIRLMYTRTGGRVPIIGVGGIFTPLDALEKLAAGASLLQASTGFVYQGPNFAKSINQGLLDFMDSWGIRALQELVGNLDILEYTQSHLSS